MSSKPTPSAAAIMRSMTLMPATLTSGRGLDRSCRCAPATSASKTIRDGCLVVLPAIPQTYAQPRLMCYHSASEDVPAFVELESGGPPPVACQVVGVGQLPTPPTKEGDRREQHLPEEQSPCPA